MNREIINLTKERILIIQALDIMYVDNRAYADKNDIAVIADYPPFHGKEPFVSYENNLNFLETKEGVIPISCRTRCIVEGLPDQLSRNAYYIVSKEIADLAQKLGRFDLLAPINPVYSGRDNIKIGGKDSYKNWQLLHRHCHDEKTRNDGNYNAQLGTC